MALQVPHGLTAGKRKGSFFFLSYIWNYAPGPFKNPWDQRLLTECEVARKCPDEPTTARAF